MAIGRAAALSTLLIFAAVLSTEGCGVAVNKNQEASSREIHRVRREAPETIVDDVKAVNEDLPHEARKLLWHSEDINDRDGNKKSRTKRDLSWPSSSLGTWSDLLSGLTAEAEAEPTAGDVLSQVQAEAEPSLDDLLSQAQAQVQAEPSIDEFLEQSQSQSQGQSQSEFQGISQDIQIVNGTIVYCQQDCENGGVCTGLNVCRCAPGWTGTYCTDPICNPVCANGGVCTAPNECQCEEGYEGDQCQTAICHSTCENGGYCSRPDFCTCQIGYAGQQCETPVCDPSCLHGGACSAPDTCTCQAGWEGPICQTPICTLECQNGGVCTEPGRCSCPSSFGGPQCQYDLYQDDGITQVQTTPAPDHSGRFCGAFGHQHYFTFDGHFYTFPGTCQYLLSGDCLQATFQVFVRNDPNCTTSSLLCHREVRVHMMGLSHDLILHQGHNYEVTKGDVTLSLPNSEEGVKVEKVGDYVRVILMPEFDGKLVRVAVYWDGVTSVYVEVDEDFAGNLCGLCGNFNGNSSDEYRLRDGTASSSRITFANSWKMTDAEEHCPNVHVNTPNSCASATQQQLQEIWGICNVLIGNAAFAPCHAVVDPNPYIDACVTDLCNCDYAVRGDCQCEALTQYSRACAHRRIVLDWRQPELCYRGCPATMVYTECASSCPRTCRNPTGDHDCDDHCVDGCSCPEGSLWDEGSLQCVVEQECPCTHLGMEYAPGSNYLDDCNKYYCLAGRWIGTNLECNATCSIHGDPHITTFDKRYYQFAGVCQYIVAKDFVNQQFTLLADQQPCGDDDSSSCIRSVTLIVGGNTAGKIKLHQHGVLSVGHSDVHLQLPYHNDDVSVRRLSSVFVEVTTNFGLTLQWDGRGRLYTTVTPALKGHTKGLCGTFNDKQNDDFTTRSGVIVANVAEFGNSWKVSADCEDQPVVTSDLQLGPCAINTQRAEYARQHCGLMSGGSFEACNRLLEPATYITACEYDVCQCQDGDECLCSAIAHYARECAKLGAVVNWRTEGNCVEECPQVGQVWQECSSACRSSCRYLSEPDSGCTEDCVAGCNCPPGLYQSESGACVPQEECQCFYQGEVYQKQTSTVLGNLICFCEDGIMNCQERVIMSSEYNCTSGMEYFDCEGAAAGQMGKACEETCGNIGMECLAEQCVSGCQCPHGLVRDGSECVLPEECRCEHNGQMYDPGQTISVDCNSCTCSQGVWSCTTKECAAQCSMFGNSHYTTFDGHSYEFEGTCKYIIAQDYCYNQTGSFRIHAEKTACNGLSGNVCARTVTVTLQQLQIHLEHGKDVHVGPIPGSEVAYTSYKFNIYRSGFFTIIKVENGIDLYWDNATRLYIKVWPNHRGRVCGMCGNFDGNQINDFNTPELDRATTVQDFANSWKVSSSCPDVEAPLSDYCALHPHREAWARRQCNIILSDTFSPCHYKVDPEPYYQACVQDSCSCDSGGDCECFCTAVAAYGDMCNTQDVHIRWRTHELCPTQCEDYNWDPEKCEWHYDPCGTSCPATCEDPHPSSCDLQCMEGCHPKCPNGTVLYNGKCIPPMDCPVTTTTPLPTTTAFIPTTVSTTLLPTTTESIATTTLEVTTASETTPMPTTTGGGEGGGKTTTAATTEVTPTGSPSPPVQTTTEATTTQSTTTFSTTTPEVTTPCEHAEVCYWTSWINSDLPRVQRTADNETLAHLLQAGSNICMHPSMIECRTSSHNPDNMRLIPVEQVDQEVTCDVDQGFLCLAELQENPFCLDYEVRLYCCSCGGTVPPISTTSQPTTTESTTSTVSTTTQSTTTESTTISTTQPTTTETTTTIVSTTPCEHVQEMCEWKEWMNKEYPNPNSPSQNETYANLRDTYDFCDTPMDIQCSISGMPMNTPFESMAQQGVICDINTGLYCDASQIPGFFAVCYDYEIRVKCCWEECVTPTSTEYPPTTTESTTFSTTTEPTTTESTTSTVSTTTQPTTTESIVTTTPCEHVEEMCEWSDWMNKDEPSGGNPNQNETYDNLRDTYEFCEAPMDIECSVAGMEGTQMSLPEGVSCDQATGLVCYASQLPGKGQVCEDYQIRVKCCSEKCVTPVPTTSRPTTTPTTTVSTTTQPTTTETTTVSTTTQPTTTETTTVSTTAQPTTTETTSSTTVMTPTGSPSPTQPPTTESTTVSTTSQPTTTESTTVSTTTQPTTTESTTSTVFTTTQPTTTESTTVSTTTQPTTTESTTSTVSTTTQPTTTESTTVSTTTQPTTTESTTSTVSTTTQPTTTESTTVSTTVQSTTPTSCGYVCNWTDWMNSYNPSTDMQLNDVETLENLHSRFSFCETPMGIECRYAENPSLDFIDHHQPGVTCEVDSGLYCDASLTNVGACMDYEVRFQCCHVPDTCKTTTTVTTEVPTTTTTVTTERPLTTITTESTTVSTTTQPTTTESTTISTTTQPTTTESTTVSTTTQPTTTESTTVSTTTQPTTTESTTVSTTQPTTTESIVTTTPCEHVEEMCEWSDWMNKDEPSGGNPNQNETYDNLRDTYEFCEEPMGIECSVAGMEGTQMSLPEGVSCDQATGLVCYASQLPGKGQVCEDYQIRVKCCSEKCVTPVPTTTRLTTTQTTTVSTTTVPTTTEATTSVTTEGTTSIATPTGSPSPHQTTTISTTPITTSTHSTTQPPTTTAYRPTTTKMTTTQPTTTKTETTHPTTTEEYTTPPVPITTEMQTTQPTTTMQTTQPTTTKLETTPTSCGYVCNWTDWMNSYNPSTDMDLNDVETLENLHSRFSFCETPMGIECQLAENPSLDFIDHHQNGVTCEVDSGLYCNSSLTNMRACMDYEVRFQCCHVPDSCKTTTTMTTEVPTTTTVTTKRPTTTITTESTTVSMTTQPTTTESTTVSTTTQPTTTESTTVSTTALPTTTAFLPPSTTECPDVCIDGSGLTRQVGDTWFEAGDQCQRALYLCRPCGVISINRKVCDVVEPPSCANGLQPIDVGVCCPEYQCPCECKGYGDPHYFSFDGEYFYFQGEGEFILARDTHVPHDFEVRGFNVQCTVAPITTCTKEIKVIYKGHTIELKTGHQVLVNGTSWTPPFKLDGCKVTTMGFPLKLEIQSLDVTVVYDFLSSGFYISVPPTMYAGKTEGLCGPCNNNKTDDCQDREGTIMNDYNNCSCDWKVDNPDSPSNSCIPEPKPTATPSTPCDQSPCDIITDPEGPFGACHDVVDYEFFLQSCQYDRGACYSECQALGAYAYVCQRMGVCVDWRGKGNNCSFECEAGLVYKACSCVKTCENMDVFNASQCALAYMETEGCFCPDDMVLHETSEQCIEGDTCNGCEDANGMPLAIGDTWIPYNDSCQECTCTGHKKTECYPRACPTYRPPKCGVCESQRVVEGSDSCCPEYECVCDLNRADCPEVVIPQCEYQYQYVHHTNPGECVPEYECRCNSSQCPAAPQCEPPKVMDMSEGECCLEYECVCDACPTAPTPYCPPGEGYVLVSSEDICGCVTQSCQCRKDTCAQQPECDDNKDLVTTETDCCPHYNCTCDTCPPRPVIDCNYAEGYVLVSSQDDCGCVTESCECREDSCSPEPECPDNKHVFTMETGCCPHYNCSCNTCPPSPTPGSDCPYGEMPGYVIHETVDDCGCVNSSCTCDRSRCPAPPTCDDNKNLVALYTPCCQNYTCECKECPVDDTSCGIGETQTTIIDDCCSHTNCTPEPVCVYQNTTHQPGTSWTDANDNCIQCQCLEEIDPATGFHRVSCSDESSQCEVNCPACHTYQERSGECCGECVKTSCCVMDDDETLVEHPAGSNWTSPGDSCSRCHCLEAGEHGQVVEYCSTLLCPEPPTCSSDEVMKNTSSADGCCTIYECVPPGQASCSLFTKQDYLRVDDCVSLQPVNVTWCEGRCGSSSMYEGVDLKHTCECCHEVSMSEVSVPMECEGTTTSSMSYAYRQITACDCDTTECEVPTAQP